MRPRRRPIEHTCDFGCHSVAGLTLLSSGEGLTAETAARSATGVVARSSTSDGRTSDAHRRRRRASHDQHVSIPRGKEVSA